METTLIVLRWFQNIENKDTWFKELLVKYNYFKHIWLEKMSFDYSTASLNPALKHHKWGPYYTAEKFTTKVCHRPFDTALAEDLQRGIVNISVWYGLKGRARGGGRQTTYARPCPATSVWPFLVGFCFCKLLSANFHFFCNIKTNYLEAASVAISITQNFCLFLCWYFLFLLKSQKKGVMIVHYPRHWGPQSFWVGVARSEGKSCSLETFLWQSLWRKFCNLGVWRVGMGVLAYFRRR